MIKIKSHHLLYWFSKVNIWRWSDYIWKIEKKLSLNASNGNKSENKYHYDHIYIKAKLKNGQENVRIYAE